MHDLSSAWRVLPTASRRACPLGSGGTSRYTGCLIFDVAWTTSDDRRPQLAH